MNDIELNERITKSVTALIIKHRNEAVEACARIVEPKGPRPCDCERCYCHNSGDADAVSRWDEATANAKAIRSLSHASALGDKQ